MNLVSTRRRFMLASLGIVAAGCQTVRSWFSDGPSGDAPMLNEEELVRAAVSPAQGTFTGTIEARSFMSYDGCSSPGKLLRWMVLATDGKRLPIRIIGNDALARLRAGREDAVELDDADKSLLSPDDAGRYGIEIGERARIEGIYAPLLFSGTIALQPIYGLCTARIDHA
jgi:hypothetical protein